MTAKLFLGALMVASMLFMCGMVQELKEDYASFVRKYKMGDTALTITALEK